MRRSPTFVSFGLSTAFALTALCAVSCAGGGVVSEDAGQGGSPGTGGASPATGGANGSGGGSGGAAPATGGMVGTGGTTSAGGSAAGGSAAGGATGSGGVGTGGGSGGRGGGAGGSAGATGRGGGAGGGRGGAGGSVGAAGASGAAGGGAAGVSGAAGAGNLQWPKKFCGNIPQRGQIASNYDTYWDQITPENEGKWGSIEGTQGKFNWTALDKIHDYAKQHNIPFKQHNFVWGSQQPSWIGGLSQADQKAAVQNWIQQFCMRYPDTQMIDVLNEPPPHTTPPYLAALGGAGASGYDWVVTIFKWARQYCPTSILIVNDYNIIEYSNDNNNIIKLVTAAMKAGAPIDAVGAQSHALQSASASTTQMYIDKIASSTGLPILISEFDLNIADDTQQKNQMQSLFTMFWNDKNVKGVTYWGYIQGQTWETNSWLLSSGGTERSAMSWLMQFVGR
jgi:endo-1,4-beta-xylanase